MYYQKKKFIRTAWGFLLLPDVAIVYQLLNISYQLMLIISIGSQNKQISADKAMICTGKGQYFTEKKRILCQHQVCEGKQGKFSCWFEAGGWEPKDGISGLSKMGPPYLFNVFCWFLFFSSWFDFFISFFPSGWDAFPPGIFEQNFELNGVTESRNGLGWDLRTSQFHPLLPWAGTKYPPGIFYSNLTFPQGRGWWWRKNCKRRPQKKKREIFPNCQRGKPLNSNY